MLSKETYEIKPWDNVKQSKIHSRSREEIHHLNLRYEGVGTTNHRDYHNQRVDHLDVPEEALKEGFNMEGTFQPVQLVKGRR